MENKDIRTINRILQYIDSILKYSKNIRSVKEMSNNTMLVEAICFDLLQIGELVKDGLTSDTKEKIELIPWHQINGLRNRIVHGYDSIKLDIVYETIKNDIPLLKKELKKYLKDER